MVGNGSISIPKWLEVLLSEKFFNACLVHELERKNEENVFCLDCCFSLCLHCLPSHHCHKLLQIRRYVYQDVLRLKEADKLLDCSFVQSYTTNSAKVVFLNQRPITRQFKNSLNYTCIVCDRSIQRPNLFCSISCKVQHMVSCSKVYNLIKYNKSSITINSSEFCGHRRKSMHATSQFSRKDPLETIALDFVGGKRKLEETTMVRTHATRDNQALVPLARAARAQAGLIPLVAATSQARGGAQTLAACTPEQRVQVDQIPKVILVRPVALIQLGGRAVASKEEQCRLERYKKYDPPTCSVLASEDA
ncbi:uncharacterized protein [Nicotiana sylvestris]|uniref:uncharacterized protein n=1 Tax=Nicotiana sylvestris TaxID=4096 RepID=UPI00388CC610